MAVVITGEGINTPDGGLDAADLTGDIDASLLTGTLPALDGSGLTGIDAANLTGTLPAIDGSSLTGIGAPTSYDAVGTYAFMYYSSHGYPTPGTSASGSSLYPANGYSYGGMSGNRTAYGSASGTWILMGLLGYHNGTARNQADTANSVWLRIS